jgi:hypothetical protein
MPKTTWPKERKIKTEYKRNKIKSKQSKAMHQEHYDHQENILPVKIK